MHDPFLAYAPRAPGDLAFVKRLQESQWWDPEELLEHQLALLDPLVAHARTTVPFYTARLAAAGLDSSTPLTLDAWRGIPPLIRREVQRSHAELESSAVPDGHGAPISMHTSGSTSTPVTILTTDVDSWVGGLTSLRHYLWHSYDFSARMVAIRRFGKGQAEYPTGDTSVAWGPIGLFPFKTGPSARLDVSASIDEQLEWLARQDPDYLCTYPSNAVQLALASRRKGLVFPHLEHIVTVGEVVTPDTRQVCADAWDAPVIDTYSAQEVGVLAHQCPGHEHYHIQAETVLVEVVDRQGNPCGPGEIGDVLVTSFSNYAMPLLRYRVGDFAEVGHRCTCGRGLPVLTRILGRERNSVLIAPTGERYWPVFGTYGFPRIAPVIQHQFVQQSKERVLARLVTERPLTKAEEDGLREHIQAQLPWRFDIAFAYCEEIPRNASGKFEPFVSEIPEDDAI